MRVTLVLAALSLGMLGAEAARAQSVPPSGQVAAPSDRTGDAYEQYLLAHRLEQQNDTAGVVAAYRRAMELDPTAPDIPAELASYYLRQGSLQEAMSAAEQALKLEPDNREANRVLGMAYAATADAARDNATRTSKDTAVNLAKAIRHLEAALDQPVGEPNPNVVATLARLYVATGEHTKAIPLLAGLVEREPGWQDGVVLLIDAYVGAGQIKEAIPWLEQQALNDPRLLPALADLYERELRWKDAASAYERALPGTPRNADLKTRYASALLTVGGRANVVKAREALAEALSIRATDARSLYLLSQAERRLGNMPAAVEAARKLITAQGGRGPWGYYALAEALEEQRNYKGVLEALEPAASTFRAQAGGGTSELALLLPHIGFAQQELGDFDKAIAAFDEAYRLSPIDPVIAGGRIEVYIAARKFGAAAEMARQARTGGLQTVQFARLEALALRREGKADQAIALLEDVARKNTGDPNATLALAQVYAETGHGGQAVRVLQDGQARFPDDTSIAFELGATYEKQMRYSDAEAAFRRVIASDPDHAAALNYLGYMLAERGERLDESVAYVKRALQMEPNNGSFIDSLGWAYYKAGQLDLAESNLRLAAEQMRTNSVVQDHYGDVLFKQGRYSDAVAAWNRALAGEGESIDRGVIGQKIRAARQKIDKK